MPPLDSERLDDLRRRLDAREAELRGELAEADAERRSAPSRAPGDPVEDAGEVGEQRYQDALRDAERTRDVDELRAIAEARVRLREGRYGECVDCGRDIAPARLEAEPSAARCIDCQRRHEETHPGGVRIPPLGGA